MFAKKYWENSQGYISKDRATIGLLAQERHSTRSLFDVIISQAFTRQILVRQEDKTFAMWGEGTRPWGLRELAAAAGMCVNTVQYGLYRLAKIGLIRRVSNKLGTIIQALKFYQYRRKNPNVGVTPLFTHPGDTRASQNNTYRRDSLVDPKIISKSSNVNCEKTVEFSPVMPETDAGRRVKEFIRSISRRK